IAANADIGCVSGPPGTGKSYTIAATAAENLSRHRTVLIVAHTETALEVIGDKLEQNFNLGDVCIRAGKKEYLKELKNYLTNLLSGYFSESILEPEKEIAVQLKKVNRRLNNIEKRFIRDCRKAIKRGQRIKKFEDAQAKFWLDLYLTFTRAKIKSFGSQWKKLDQINQLLEKREALASRYLAKVKEENLKILINKHRKSLQAFNKAIRSRTSKRQSEYFDEIEFSVLLSAFPVWLVSLSTLHKVLPLTKEMFDLVIIDEATQCNISSCIPAFYRAKRALVVGDTKQLKHYSFLSRSKQQQILDSHQLTSSQLGIVSYRDNSILDLALDSLDSENQIAFLDEHFRSNPELIHFSNKQFYQDKLKVMQHRPCTSSGFLRLVKVEGARDKKGVNKIEAESVLEKIEHYVSAESDQKYKTSIGVVSPFRNQAEHLEKQIEKRFTQDEILSHSIRASTPFGFQGEERDIMLLSFSLDNRSKRAASYLNKQDVFNVAITRARQKQYLFLSIDSDILPQNNLLKTYLESADEFQAEHEINHDNDEFQKDVECYLNELGIECWAGYSIAGHSIDLLCRKDGTYLALDLIGFPGPWADFFELNTYKIFKRAGINILPISYGFWKQDKQVCIDVITANLSRS
ncbi:MAG: AAA domain-containing protein, partial [Kangiellaceae bacterium]|nr:AAA domain-containing protein [Kangiellaceae bacterium]